MWKILTIQIAKEISPSRQSKRLLPEEEKVWKRPKESNNLLYIHWMILRKLNQDERNISKEKIDNKKAHDIIVQNEPEISWD